MKRQDFIKMMQNIADSVIIAETDKIVYFKSFMELNEHECKRIQHENGYCTGTHGFHDYKCSEKGASWNCSIEKIYSFKE